MGGQAALRWDCDLDLSIIHATCVVASGGQSVEPRAESVFSEVVQSANQILEEEGITPSEFWEQFRAAALATGAQIESLDGLFALLGQSFTIGSLCQENLASILGNAKGDLISMRPPYSDQLHLRYGPLRARWDTCGVGLLRMISTRLWGTEQISESYWPDAISLVMVQPTRGGDGGIAAEAGRVWMEAVLTDVDPEIPEVLRLAWLVSSIPLQRSMDHGTLDASKRDVLNLALVPLILEVGREFDLIKTTDLPVEKTLGLWQPHPTHHAAALVEWWSEQGREELIGQSKAESLANRLSQIG